MGGIQAASHYLRIALRGAVKLRDISDIEPENTKNIVTPVGLLLCV
jgi:hypothetical protein